LFPASDAMKFVTAGRVTINVRRILYFRTTIQEEPEKGRNVGDIIFVAIHFSERGPGKQPLILKDEEANEFLSQVTDF
jgi:hypothetical protein